MDLQSVSFSGKTGIITGGAQGIGKAIARQFVDMGGKAVIVDINPETAARTCGELGTLCTIRWTWGTRRRSCGCLSGSSRNREKWRS